MCPKCQNSYCSKCIKYWEKKSNQCPFKCDSPSYTTARVVKNLISKLNFKCKNGCNEIIPFEKIQSHCDFECKKLNFKERYEKLLIKYNEKILKNYLNLILIALFLKIKMKYFSSIKFYQLIINLILN